MTAATELPQELCYDPMSFVVLTGLDIKFNAIHKSIWDAFSNNRRTERVPISFGCLPGDHCYPRSKDKRTSYEWYIPKGILKTKWMDKHLHQVPAVVVIFYELDWDEPAWREKQIECASRVEVVRTSLQARGTKVAVVLIQKSTPLPPGEDMVAAERASALCSSCDLSAKALFVLPHTDHLLGYIIRLENAFYELANSYYHTEARRVKAHKEYLNKTTHQLLFPRHQFKIGFLNELMQDPTNAVKHYRQAYTHLHELRSHDTNNLEVKVMGGFINYKICRLYFLRLNTPLEAIAQFRRHIDLFKPKTGNAELLFEHSAWMSKQFTVFGDLFDEAIKAGLAAIQTQHPGFYYQQGAYYAQERRSQARKLCMAAAEQEYPLHDPLDTGGQPLDFYGQRPWRQGHQSIDPPDAGKEKDGKLALNHQEATIDHSWLIIPLLSNAVAQFKKYKCPRMKRFLTVQMGEEYYHAQDYSKAATLLSHTAWDYRSNRWWDILNRILILTLRCSYLIANVQQYISTSLELIGRHSLLNEQERTRIQMNLIRVIDGKVPDSEPMTSLDKVDNNVTENDHIEALEAAKHMWTKALSEPSLYTSELNNLVPFVECKTSFKEEKSKANSLITLFIHLRTSCPFPIRFSHLMVSLGKQLYDKHCMVTDSTLKKPASDHLSRPGDLYFEPFKLKTLSFSFPPDQSDVGRTVNVSSVTLKLGGDSNGNCAVLVWNVRDGGVSHDVTKPLARTKQLVANEEKTLPKKWIDILPISGVEIEQRTPLMVVDVVHKPPALIGEVYRIRITALSQEKQIARNVRAIVRLEPGQAEDIYHSTHLALNALTVLSCPATKALEVNFGDLSPGETVSGHVFVHVTKSGTRKLSTRVTYDISDQISMDETAEQSVHRVECNCSQEISVAFNAVKALELVSQLLMQNLSPLMFVRPDSRFLAHVSAKCSSPWPIEIKGGAMTLVNQSVSGVNGTGSEILDAVTLENGESASDVICLHYGVNESTSNETEISFGKYSLEWRRQQDNHKDALPFVSSAVQLPDLSVKKYPLRLEADFPPFGVVGQQLPLSYKIENCSDGPHELEILCEVAENFMFSGVKLQRFRILPASHRIFVYGLRPLAPGFQLLPTFHIKEILTPDTESSNVARSGPLKCSYLENEIPKSIFVKPSGKG